MDKCSLTLMYTHTHSSSLSSWRVNTADGASWRLWPRLCTPLHYGSARDTGSTTARICSLWRQRVLRPTLSNPWIALHTGTHPHTHTHRAVLKCLFRLTSRSLSCLVFSLMFEQRVRSWRELPVRWADFGALHRNELSGALGGLTRVRRFCQDDAHIFCTPEQVCSARVSLCFTFFSRSAHLCGAVGCLDPVKDAPMVPY